MNTSLSLDMGVCDKIHKTWVSGRADYYAKLPASVAQVDACPTSDQEIAGSATFFHGD